MSKKSKSTNAGVHNATGIELQKNFALYILLNSWKDIKDRKYFISIESHDDFLFCYQTEYELISSIDSYQSKKKSTGNWTLTKNFFEILRKILEVGIDLKNDSMEKDKNYFHNLHFITNSTPIELKENGQKVLINEENTKVKFFDLNSSYQKKIQDQFTSLFDRELFHELDNLILLWIDLNKTVKEQKRQLIGTFADVFGDKVINHKASIEVLLNLFREVEVTFNQQKIPQLLDKSKRVSSDKINKAINVITTQQKAFDIWRNKKDEIASKLHLSMRQQSKFEQSFNNSFDLFKDLTQQEHQKIYNFMKSNDSIFDNCYNHEECIELFYNKFNKEINTQLDELDVKAAIFAAYVEIGE